MSADWRRYCHLDGLEVDGYTVQVLLPAARRQRVRVDEEHEAYHLTSVVARAGVLPDIRDLAQKVWLRNRSRSLVGFRFDDRGRLVGEAWVPKAGLKATEFRTYLQAVAAESDHFENVLTGSDTE